MDYKYFKKQKDFYSYIAMLQNSGYVLKKHYFLAYLFEKDNHQILVSPFKIKNLDKFEEELDKYRRPYNIVKPNYNDTNLNLVAGIRKNFGYDYHKKVDEKIFDKKYDHVVILLLDGLGKNVLNYHLDENSFLKEHCFKYITSIFPSTTACSTTALKTGKEPIATGWTGWHNYFKEIEKDVILFTGVNYYDEKDRNNLKAYDMIPCDAFFKDMGFGRIIEPSNFKNVILKEQLNRSLETLKEDKVQYVYHTEPDAKMHQKGTYVKSITKILKKIDKDVKEYAEKLPQNTLLLVVADHGHLPVYKDLTFYYNQELTNMLTHKPSNDTRCLVFRVKDEYKHIFKERFKLYYEDVYDIYDTKEAIDNHFFGLDDKPHERIEELLGDFIAIAKSDYLLYAKKDFKFRSHHAGYTEEEMIVPVIVYKK